MLESIRHSDHAEMEREIRIDLAAAYRLVALYGWDDLIFTHLSARIPGPEHHFLINPFELMFEEVTASSLVKIDLEGKPVEPTTHLVNAAGFTIHSALHMARDDAMAVMHLHSPYGQAVSAMKEGVLPHTQTGMIARGDIAFHNYEGIAIELEERARIVQDMGTKTSMLLRNHGTLVVGESVAMAFIRLYFLERACQAQVLMLAAGADGLYEPPLGATEKVAGQATGKEFGPAADIAWRALRRKLDRLDPSYRD